MQMLGRGKLGRYSTAGSQNHPLRFRLSCFFPPRATIGRPGPLCGHANKGNSAYRELASCRGNGGTQDTIFRPRTDRVHYRIVALHHAPGSSHSGLPGAGRRETDGNVDLRRNDILSRGPGFCNIFWRYPAGCAHRSLFSIYPWKFL